MIRKQKEEIVSQLRDRLVETGTAILINYQGLSVGDSNKLRKELRGSGARLLVVKNTLVKRAVEGTPLAVCTSVLDGPTAVAVVDRDFITSAKALLDFTADHPTMSIKAAVWRGEYVRGQDLKAISSLPPREVLVAKLLGILNSPIVNFVRVLNAPLRGFITAADAVRRTREQSGGTES
jgi:large subunit ribosomal protein L10